MLKVVAIPQQVSINVPRYAVVSNMERTCHRLARMQNIYRMAMLTIVITILSWFLLRLAQTEMKHYRDIQRNGGN